MEIILKGTPKEMTDFAKGMQSKGASKELADFIRILQSQPAREHEIFVTLEKNEKRN